jgi:hypothetical protein
LDANSSHVKYSQNTASSSKLAVFWLYFMWELLTSKLAVFWLYFMRELLTSKLAVLWLYFMRELLTSKLAVFWLYFMRELLTYKLAVFHVRTVDVQACSISCESCWHTSWQYFYCIFHVRAVDIQACSISTVYFMWELLTSKLAVFLLYISCESFWRTIWQYFDCIFLTRTTLQTIHYVINNVNWMGLELSHEIYSRNTASLDVNSSHMKYTVEILQAWMSTALTWNIQ